MSPSAKNGLLVAAAVACGLVLSARPWSMARAERADAAARTQEAVRLEDQMVRDQARAGRLGTELGKEELVRSQGYRKTNEQPLK